MNLPLKRFLRWALALTALCLLLEAVVFNFDALSTRGLTPIPLTLADADIRREEIAREQNDITAVMPSTQTQKPLLRTTAAFSDLALEGIHTAALELTGDTQLIRAQLALSDDAHRSGFASADTLLILPGQRAYGRLESHGVLHGLTLTFTTEDETAALTGVTLNAPIPYRFSVLRLAAMLLPALLLAAVLCFRLWTVILDRRNPRHRLAYLLTALLCCALVLAVAALCTPFDSARFPYTRGLEYPFENSVYQYRSLAHAVLFDTLAKGRVSVDASPDPALLALENPYDATARRDSGAEVMLDYALYEGQYYSYFGLTPVLVFYAPFYWVMGHLPAYTTAACFFALLTVAAAFLCAWEALRRFVPRASLLLACFGAAAAALGCNTLMLQACADRYHLSIASMQAFFFLTLWAGFAACRQKTRLRRSLLFILCAVFTCLLVESRATGALAAAAWILPLFIRVLLSKKQTWKRKAADALSFLLPLAAGAAGIMAYNAARFGSPLEFGQTWQLTLEDIHYNGLQLRDLGQAIYYYFFEGLRLTPQFPYITLGTGFVNRTGNWFYGIANAGALTLPLVWGALLIFSLPEKRSRGKLPIYLCALLSTPLIALLDFDIAGVAQRYVCDLLPTLCLLGMLTLTELSSRDVQEGRGRSSALTSLLCAATCLIALCLVFSNYRNFISQYNPAAYISLYRIFTL